MLTVNRLRTVNSRVTRGSCDRHAIVNNLRYISPSTFSRRVTCATLNRVRGTRHMSNERGIECTKDPVPVSFTRGRCRRKIIRIAFSKKYTMSVVQIRYPELVPLVDIPGKRPTSPRVILRVLGRLPMARKTTPCLRMGILLSRPRPVLQRRIRRTLTSGGCQLTHVISACHGRAKGTRGRGRG